LTSFFFLIARTTEAETTPVSNTRALLVSASGEIAS